jgi:hypothetical protein
MLTTKELNPAALAKLPLTFSGNAAHKIVEKCVGCGHVQTIGEDQFCKAFNDPAAKWMIGSCNLGTHVVRKLGDVAKKVNPLKASKKAMKGKG